MQVDLETQVRSLGQEDPLEDGMSIHSSILAWRISRAEKSGGCSPWHRTESDATEATQHARARSDKETEAVRGLSNWLKVTWLEVDGYGPPKALFNAVLKTTIFNYEQGSQFLIQVLM